MCQFSVARQAGSTRGPYSLSRRGGAIKCLSRCVCVVLALVGMASADSPRNAVVKITVTHRRPNTLQPWTKLAPSKASGTGVIIDGNRVLTNAHVVQYGSQIYVQPYQSTEKLAASVQTIASDVDLALLTVDDPSLFEDRAPLAISSSMARVKDKVNVYGYPIGGSDLSVTEGIVSRVEYAKLYQDGAGIRIQVDAALNQGNSGGPALSQDEIIGLVFSGIPSAENTGYLISSGEIQMFLDDIKDGQYDGKPKLFGQYQSTENGALREWLRLPSDQSGVLVQQLDWFSEPTPLKPGDVITAIDGMNVDDLGDVRMDESLRLSFQYWIPKSVEQSQIALTIWRDGKSENIDTPVLLRRNRLIPPLRGAYPRYFIYGPLVLSVASQEYIGQLMSSRSGLGILMGGGSPLLSRLRDKPDIPGEELVVVPSGLLPHKVAKGYQVPPAGVVTHINGQPVVNLRQLAEVLSEMDDPFVRFEFAGRYETLVFKRDEIEASTDEILTEGGIRHECSADLRDIWPPRDAD